MPGPRSLAIIAARLQSSGCSVGPGLATVLGILYHFWAVCSGCPNANLHIPDLSTNNLSLDKPVTSH